MKDPPAASRDHPSSDGSPRATCSSPNRPPKPSTSSCRCLAGSSPTTAACFHTPRSSSREYGIPGVVGTREATERIADGVLVRVDGDAGEVTVLG